MNYSFITIHLIINSLFFKELFWFQLLKCACFLVSLVFYENWISSGFGLLVIKNETFEDVTLDFGKSWWTFFTIFWHFIDSQLID